ncbi:isoprene synthase, chloroplastic [Cajanus cajan]|nr:isoprene synthase, chloroplastic [Cajanus cajan]
MASELLSLPFCLSTTQVPCRSRVQVHHRHVNAKFLNRSGKLICAATKQDSQLSLKENRRSANYTPSIWTPEILQSLGNPLAAETVQERAMKLEEMVRVLINSTDMEPRSLVEFIEDVHRLGLAHRFEDDINKALKMIISTEYFKDQSQKSLHDTALLFRILRGHGFDVSQDVFKSFQDEEGNFKADISEDVQGLLSLYEASYLAFEGESLWEKANEFSRTHLMNLMKEGIEGELGEQVRHVLDGLPYHRCLARLEARRYFDTYTKMEPHHRSLLELAKLDFNMVQSTYQKELKEASRWWTKDIGIISKVNFFRDRLMETYFWAVGMIPDESQFPSSRNELMKDGLLIIVVDDAYDVYGTLDEMEIFTDAVVRWDVDAINSLPDKLKLSFLAVYNSINVMAYDIFKERGINCLPYLKKAWIDLCKAYIYEARCFHNKVIPPFKEFLDTALISVGGGVLLIHSYFLVCKDLDITQEGLQALTDYHDILRCAMKLVRLINDLGTAMDEMERGETSNSILSYMNETGNSEEEAREYFKILIDKEWKYLNKFLVMDSPFPKSFIQLIMNIVRICHCAYQNGDGFAQQGVLKNRIKSVLVDPVLVDVA